jgi:hypothetical protein
MNHKTCVVPDCGLPRWTGPSGTNPRLTRCEEHQKAYWRETKTPHKPETERTCTACGETFPLTEEYFYLRKERGTFRRQCKGCYDKRQAKMGERQPRRKNGIPRSEVSEAAYRLGVTLGLDNTQQSVTVLDVLQAASARLTGTTPATPAETVKVLVVDYAHDRVYRCVVPIIDPGKPISDTRNIERLVEFYRRSGHVVVEV